MRAAAAAARCARRQTNEWYKLPKNTSGLSCWMERFFSDTTSSTRQQERQAEVQAKRARRKAMEQKRAQMDAFLQSQHQQELEITTHTKQGNDRHGESTKQEQKQEELERYELGRNLVLMEAAALTKSLYRSCLRCVKVMRPGNEHDEKEFQELEAKQFAEMEKAFGSSSGSSGKDEFFSMAPPVNRENELSSRAAYYYAWTREGVEQESDCLEQNPLRQENVDRYLYFLRKGEYRRKWILKDYKFEDPYPNTFDKNRVNHFEEQARGLISDT